MGGALMVLYGTCVYNNNYVYMLHCLHLHVQCVHVCTIVHLCKYFLLFTVRTTLMMMLIRLSLSVIFAGKYFPYLQ